MVNFAFNNNYYELGQLKSTEFIFLSSSKLISVALELNRIMGGIVIFWLSNRQLSVFSRCRHKIFANKYVIVLLAFELKNIQTKN